MANIDPKSHGTTFNMSHALLIYVLMTEGMVSLPRIMRNILLTRPLKHSRHLLPYPVFISRLASECRVPEYPGDEFYTVREVEMYCPYGDWKGERPRIRRGRLYSLEPSLHEVMRRLDRQERLLLRQSRQIANTQLMIRQAFLETNFIGLECNLLMTAARVPSFRASQDSFLSTQTIWLPRYTYIVKSSPTRCNDMFASAFQRERGDKSMEEAKKGHG
ncbi:hypothetical protein PIB30_092719, partial [Stylosanthes scabra]|nr:hypothetical protein [Stylosanthes scabra]